MGDAACASELWIRWPQCQREASAATLTSRLPKTRPQVNLSFTVLPHRCDVVGLHGGCCCPPCLRCLSIPLAGYLCCQLVVVFESGHPVPICDPMATLCQYQTPSQKAACACHWS